MKFSKDGNFQKTQEEQDIFGALELQLSYKQQHILDLLIHS